MLPIEAAVFPEPWSAAVFDSELALRHGRLYRAAWVGDDMAGYIGFMIVDDEAHITTIATAPDFQRRGVATTLLVTGSGPSRRGTKHLSLEVAAGNEPAQPLYRQFGSAPVGVRKRYYPVTGGTRSSCGPTTSTPSNTLRLEELDGPADSAPPRRGPGRTAHRGQ